MSTISSVSERKLILLVALIQFVNVLDFMMVMPLGPDFAQALGIPASEIGLIGGAYTFAAACAGLFAGPFLDQFARRKLILISLSGLILATLAGAFVWSRESMIAARIAAGIFGGPLTALAVALVADVIPAERRGVAMGKVAGGFALASVFGVPFGLELASRISWHAPFIATGVMGACVLILAWNSLPHQKPLAQNHSFAAHIKRVGLVLNSRYTLASYAFMGLSMMAGFMIIPNISAHLQMNLHYPREHLGLLYLCGGTVSFFSMRLAGKIMDNYSAFTAHLLFSTLLIAALIFGFIFFSSGIPVLIIFVCFMVGMSGRTVIVKALSSKVPAPAERGAYMSLQATVTHLSSAAGAYFSSLVLFEQENTLLHVPVIGMVSVGISLLVIPLVWYVQRALMRRHDKPIAVPIAVEEAV